MWWEVELPSSPPPYISRSLNTCGSDDSSKNQLLLQLPVKRAEPPLPSSTFSGAQPHRMATSEGTSFPGMALCSTSAAENIFKTNCRPLSECH